MKKNIIGKPYNIFLSPQARSNFELIQVDNGFTTLAAAIRYAGKREADAIRQQQRFELLERLENEPDDK